jgi:hypothetical protein
MGFGGKGEERRFRGEEGGCRPSTASEKARISVREGGMLGSEYGCIGVDGGGEM